MDGQPLPAELALDLRAQRAGRQVAARLGELVNRVGNDVSSSSAFDFLRPLTSSQKASVGPVSPESARALRPFSTTRPTASTGWFTSWLVPSMCAKWLWVRTMGSTRRISGSVSASQTEPASSATFPFSTLVVNGIERALHEGQLSAVLGGKLGGPGSLIEFPESVEFSWQSAAAAKSYRIIVAQATDLLHRTVVEFQVKKVAAARLETLRSISQWGE